MSWWWRWKGRFGAFGTGRQSVLVVDSPGFHVFGFMFGRYGIFVVGLRVVLENGEGLKNELKFFSSLLPPIIIEAGQAERATYINNCW